jgi:translation initiation factor 3 subunit H
LQVVSKIIKHGREAHFGTGTLLGLDFDGTMEVSNSFPLPGFSEEEGAKSAAQRESFPPRLLSIDNY